MRPIIKQLWSSLVASAREEERNRAAFLNGDNAAGKDARAFGFAPSLSMSRWRLKTAMEVPFRPSVPARGSFFALAEVFSTLQMGPHRAGSDLSGVRNPAMHVGTGSRRRIGRAHSIKPTFIAFPPHAT